MTVRQMRPTHRRCKRCSELLPFDEKHFAEPREHRAKFGLGGICRECLNGKPLRKPKQRTCRRCLHSYPFNNKHFYTKHGYRWNLDVACKHCISKDAADRYKRNRTRHIKTVQERRTERIAKQRITVLDYPRNRTGPTCYQSPTLPVMRKINAWICDEQLTIGVNTRVNWCHLHKCSAAGGYCDTCADLAEAKLIELSRKIAIERIIEADTRRDEAKRREREERRIKGWTPHKPAPNNWKLPLTEPRDDLWLDA